MLDKSGILMTEIFTFFFEVMKMRREGDNRPHIPSTRMGYEVNYLPSVIEPGHVEEKLFLARI